MAKFSNLGASILAALATSYASSALAFVEPQNHAQMTSSVVGQLLAKGERVIRPSLKPSTQKSFTNRFDSTTKIEVDALSGATRLITGELAPAPSSMQALTKSELIDVATNWIASHEDILQVSVDDVTLVDQATLVGDDVQFLRFNVSRAGTQIADASINFRFKFGSLVQVQAQTFGEALDDARTGFISVSDAVEKVAPGARVQERGQVLRVVATANGYKLVRVNKSIVGVDGEWLEVQTDAATGDVFESKDSKHYASNQAHGKVFARTYYQTQPIDVGMAELDLTSGTSTVRTAVDGSFSLTQSAATPSISGLKGGRIVVKPSTGTAVARTASSSGGAWDLNLDVSVEKDQAQVHTYHHLNLVIQKAKRYISSPWMDRPMTANVNLSQTCNAYWDGSSVNFFSAGGGCGNTGLISDVMYHEWGHGLDANTGGINDGAYSEGFGDIVSMVMTNDHLLGPGFRSTGGVVRDMEPDKVYPKDAGEVHAEGLIIGGTMWDLLKALTAKYDAAKANDIVSGIAFKTIMTANKYTDVYAAALVVNDNDSNPNTRSPDFCEINVAFAAHGLATRDSTCQ